MSGSNQTQGNSRRCSLIILSLAIFFILSVVVTGICVRFLLDENTARISLLILIGVLFIVGIIAVVVLEVHTRVAAKNKSNYRQQNVAIAYNANNGSTKYGPVPTAPPLSERSSSANNGDYGRRTTMQVA